jgi:hypothetical protein
VFYIPESILCDATDVRFLSSLNVSLNHHLILDRHLHHPAFVLDCECIGDTPSGELVSDLNGPHLQHLGLVSFLFFILVPLVS